MAIKVLPLEESDLPGYAHVHAHAFTAGISPFLGGDRDALEKSQLELDRKAFGTDPTCHLMKAVDTETGATLAYAKWHYYAQERSAEEVELATQMKPCAPGANPQAWNDFFGWLEDVRRRLKGGQRCWYLAVLMADATQRGRGGGGALVNWGCEQADAVDLPVWLESSAGAHALYARHGFEDMEIKYLDLTKYGGVGQDRNTAMFRKRRSERS